MDTNIIRQLVAKVVNTTITYISILGILGLPRSPSLAISTTILVEVTLNNYQNTNKLGFYNPYYNDKTSYTRSLIKYTSRDTYFRDIYLFINQAK